MTADAFEGDSVVKVSDLVAGYIPGVNILNGCSIEARRGELIGIIGPNGAGKSTLLKAMFGLVKVHSGTVVVRGQDITGLKANKLVSRGVGFVPQNNNVFSSLTIEENLQMGLYQAPKRFAERFEFVAGLFPELHKPMDGYAPCGAECGTDCQQAAFAAWEVRLYLDTHPDDMQARALLQQLVGDCCEPNYATTFLNEECARWAWMDDPWPWNFEANRCK